MLTYVHATYWARLLESTLCQLMAWLLALRPLPASGRRRTRCRTLALMGCFMQLGNIEGRGRLSPVQAKHKMIYSTSIVQFGC